MNARMLYQVSIMRCLRSKVNFATRQIEKHQPYHHVEADESDESKNRLAVTDGVAVALSCPEQTVNKPRLAAQFCGHPAERVCDEGKRKRQHERPEKPGARFQFAPESLKCGQTHQADNHRSQRHHEMESVVKQLDIIGPILSGKFIQAADIALKSAVGEKAQAAGNLDRVVELLEGHVRLTEDAD